MPHDNQSAADEAPALMDRIAQAPALDELMARTKHDYDTAEKRRGLVAALRADRAAWESKRGETRSEPTTETGDNNG